MRAKRTERAAALMAADVTGAARLAREHAHEHADSVARSAPGLSLLRLSAPARILIAAVASMLLWIAVLWALT